MTDHSDSSASSGARRTQTWLVLPEGTPLRYRVIQRQRKTTGKRTLFGVRPWLSSVLNPSNLSLLDKSSDPQRPRPGMALIGTVEAPKAHGGCGSIAFRGQSRIAVGVSPCSATKTRHVMLLSVKLSAGITYLWLAGHEIRHLGRSHCQNSLGRIINCMEQHP